MRWKLISSTRSRCWHTWLIFTSLLVLMLLGQTFSGKYGDSTLDWWIWFGVNVLPGLSVIYLSLLVNRNPAKAIPKEVHRGLLLGTWAYLLLILLTLLGQGWGAGGKLSLNEYRQHSYAWLIPFQLILLAGYWLEFARQESLFRPDARIILQLAQENADKWVKKGDTQREKCLAFILADNLPGAIEYLQQIPEIDVDTAILLQAQHARLMESILQNTVDPSEAQRTLNRITLAAMNLIDG